MTVKKRETAILCRISIIISYIFAKSYVFLCGILDRFELYCESYSFILEQFNFLALSKYELYSPTKMYLCLEIQGTRIKIVLSLCIHYKIIWKIEFFLINQKNNYCTNNVFWDNQQFMRAHFLQFTCKTKHNQRL